MALHFRDYLDRSNRRPRGKRSRLAVVVAVLAGIVADSPRSEGLTSVDCDTPDDFCTGDPCETADSIVITVASCVLDFSPRKLVIARKVFVPDSGTLSLTAGSIDMKGKLDGKHTSGAGNGADITLIASGDILVQGRIDVAGRTSVGTIALDAGGDIELEHQLRARVRGSGATASGGVVSVDADGVLTSIRRGKIDVRGRHNNTSGGQATLRGATGVTLLGRVEARGEPGGSVTIESSAGSVNLQEEIRVQGNPAGEVAVDAAVDVSIGGRRGRLRADGGFGEIAIDAGGLVSSRTISARGSNGLGLPGGTVSVLAGSVSIERFSSEVLMGDWSTSRARSETSTSFVTSTSAARCRAGRSASTRQPTFSSRRRMPMARSRVGRSASTPPETRSWETRQAATSAPMAMWPAE